MRTGQALDRRGVLAIVAAFVAWGLFPLYWHLLREVPALQIIAHRVLWSAVLVAGWLTLRRGGVWLRNIATRPRALPTLAGSSVLISVNWGLYIWAVNNGHVVESSLGYFINPLVSVLLGVLVLGERLSRLQWISVGLAALGVAWLTWQAGRAPWIAIGLAVSFGAYGLLRKLVQVDAVPGLGLESLYLLLPALGIVAWGETGHGGGFHAGWGLGTDLLLVLGGVVTAGPLVGFAYGVQRIPLSLVGLLQYIAPTLQLLLGVLVFHEPFGAARVVGFVLIWAGLLAFVGDALVRARRQVASRERVATAGKMGR